MLTKKLNILIFILVLGVLPAKTFLAEKGLANKNILLNNTAGCTSNQAAFIYCISTLHSAKFWAAKTAKPRQIPKSQKMQRTIIQ